jgi:hypothetical protein
VKLPQILAILLFFPTLVQATSYELGGFTYELIDGRWYMYDGLGEKWEVAPGILTVKFKENVPNEAMASWSIANGLDQPGAVASSPPSQSYRYDSSLDPLAVLEQALSSPIVETAFLDTYLKFLGQPDPYYAVQWNLQKMEVEPAWTITTGTASVTVAIIDGGTQFDHEDLAPTTWSNPGEIAGDGIDNDNDSQWLGFPLVDDIVGWDFFDNDNDPRPGQMFPPAWAILDLHGTACAGLAAAAYTNGLGIAGVANGCRYVYLRCNTQNNAVNALKYCWNKGVDVVSMSWTTNDPDSSFRNQIISAYAHGLVLVAAAGNSGNNPANNYVMYPASRAEVIAVGATDDHDVRLEYSTYAPGLELVAPAGRYIQEPKLDLWTTDNDGTFGPAPGTPYWGHNPQQVCACPADNGKYFQYFAGTSASCPQVAAVAALLLSHRPSLTNAQVFALLKKGAKDLGPAGYDVEYGFGRVNAYRTLTEWGTITGNVTWSPSDIRDGGPRYVSGDLTIAPGATLTIMPGTAIRIANADDLGIGADPARVEINVQGTLIADGTAANPIIFDRWGDSGDWVGIYFDAASSGSIVDNCQISHAETAIESYAPLTVKNSIIRDCTNAGVVSLAGGALIHNCVFDSPGHIGIDLQSDEAVVRNTIVDSAVDYAVRVFAFTVTTLKLRNSEFNNSGIGLFVDGNATVGIDSTCFFYQNDTGIQLYDAGSLVNIRDCGFALNTTNGIVCDGSTAPLIEYNVFAHNSGAIYSSNYATPKIQWNEIQSNGNAITAASHAAPDLGHNSASGSQSTGNNKIAHAAKYVVNNTTDQVYAENNCWDVNTTPPCNPPSSKFTGSVDRAYPQCCPFPLFTHGEGEPVPEDGFVFQDEPVTLKTEARRTTALIGVVPNPFNPNTTIRYSLASPGKVEINIYDVGGRLVQALANETQVAGQHSLEWKGTDRAGAPAASGIYFVRMVANGQTFTRKMALLK